MDLIDRQALLKQIDIDSDGEPGYYGDTWKFIDTIKSLPSVTDNNVGTELGTNLAQLGTDCISRQAAIKILHEALDAADQIADVPFGVYQNYRDKMNELPPAQPERIRGRWTRDNACSECGCQPWFSGDIHNYNFCPHCGADMREVTE